MLGPTGNASVRLISALSSSVSDTWARSETSATASGASARRRRPDRPVSRGCATSAQRSNPPPAAAQAEAPARVEHQREDRPQSEAQHRADREVEDGPRRRRAGRKGAGHRGLHVNRRLAPRSAGRLQPDDELGQVVRRRHRDRLRLGRRGAPSGDVDENGVRRVVDGEPGVQLGWVHLQPELVDDPAQYVRVADEGAVGLRSRGGELRGLVLGRRARTGHAADELRRRRRVDLGGGSGQAKGGRRTEQRHDDNGDPVASKDEQVCADGHRASPNFRGRCAGKVDIRSPTTVRAWASTRRRGDAWRRCCCGWRHRRRWTGRWAAT